MTARNPTPLPDGDRGGTRSMGTTLMLVASAMMFGALLLLYYLLRVEAPEWPPAASRPLPRGLATLATVILFASSLTLEIGVRELRRARLERLATWIGATLALGFAFFFSIAFLWFELIQGGFESRNPHGGLFYVITAVHGAHLITALGLLIWLFLGARRRRFHGRRGVPVRLVGRFWHFLGVAWLLVYLTLFWS